MDELVFCSSECPQSWQRSCCRIRPWADKVDVDDDDDGGGGGGDGDGYEERSFSGSECVVCRVIL
jgi:hypothetical protein